MKDETKVKKRWEKPGLLVVTRGRPEESVLAACKWFVQAGPDSAYSRCAVLGCSGWCSSGGES